MAKRKVALLREVVEVEMPNSSEKQKVSLGQIFVHQETGDVVCSICQKANAGGDSAVAKSGMSGNWTN